MASGHVDHFCNGVMSCSSQPYRAYLASDLFGVVSTNIVRYEHELKTKLVDIYKLKFDFWKHPPYCFFAAVAAEDSLYPREGCARIVASGLQECDQAVASGTAVFKWEGGWF